MSRATELVKRMSAYPDVDVTNPKMVSTWRLTHGQLVAIAAIHNVSLSHLIQMLLDRYAKELGEMPVIE
jgi:hypothetical protein